MSRLSKLLSGIGWGGLSMLVMVVFQLSFMAVMARLLDPADFGLVAIANVSLRFLSYFTQMGITPAIVQKPNLEDGDLGAALSISLGISIIFCFLSIVIAPFLEQFFAMDELAKVASVLALNFIIGGLASVSVGLLRRHTQFRKLAMIDAAAYVIGYGAVGLTLAHIGAGVWALVGASTSQALLSLALSYAAVRHSLNFRHTAAQRRHFFGFGGRYSVIGFFEFLSANLDALIIGKMLGVSNAGIYNRASQLANLPVQQPANVFSKALFPVLSSVSDQREKQALCLQLSTLFIGGYAFSVGAGIAAGALDIVSALLGPKWVDVTPVLQILALSVGPIYVSHVAGVTLDALGELSIKLKIQLTTLIFLPVFLLLLLPYGLQGIATAIVISEILRMVTTCSVLGHMLKVRPQEWGVISTALTCAALVCGGCVFVASLWVPPEMHVGLRLAVDVLAGVAGVLFTLFATRYLVARLAAVRTLAGRLGLARHLPA